MKIRLNQIRELDKRARGGDAEAERQIRELTELLNSYAPGGWSSTKRIIDDPALMEMIGHLGLDKLNFDDSL